MSAGKEPKVKKSEAEKKALHRARAWQYYKRKKMALQEKEKQKAHFEEQLKK
jgi:hypothetical protein